MVRTEELTQIRILRIAWLLAMLLLLAIPTVALAQGRAQVYILPPGGTITAGQPVMADVIAEGVSNLYGAEIHLRFDPAAVRLEDADPKQDGVQLTPGSLLDPTQGFVVANQVDNQAGTAVFAVTLVNPALPVEGSGVVAQVTFVPLQPGPLRLDLDNVKLVTHDLQTLDVSLSGLEVPVASSSSAILGGGETAPAPARKTSQAGGVPIWVLVLVALGMVSIPLAGAWFIFTREAKNQPRPGIH